MAQNKGYDLLVIGSGSAGVQAALEASRLQKRVALIEKHPERLGGAWIHTGTIPSKTLREVLAAIRSVESHLGAQWVQRLSHNLSSTRLAERAKQASMDEEKIILHQLEQAGVEIMRGRAFIEEPRLVRVNPEGRESFTIETEFILVATGSKPRRPAHIPFDGWRIVDSDEILRLESLPRSIAIYGGGVISCEYACIFAALGIKTTVVDSRPRIMQYIDQELAEELMKSMQDMGVRFELGRELVRLETQGPSVRAHYQGLSLETEVFLFAAGREPCSQHLGLERIGVDLSERKMIGVNRFFQTNVANIYAAGDVIGPPALASVSAEQGRLACRHAFGCPDVRFPEFYPLGVYTIPELSSVGLSEQELQASGTPYVVGRARYDQIARGYIRGDSHGLMKLLVSRENGRILGVHIFGADAANLIHIGQCCMITGLSIYDFVNSIIFNFPTLAEGYKIAAFNAIAQLEGSESLSSGAGLAQAS